MPIQRSSVTAHAPARRPLVSSGNGSAFQTWLMMKRENASMLRAPPERRANSIPLRASR